MNVNYRGIQYLRKKLALKRHRVMTRYHYYEMKEQTLDKGIVIPAELKIQYKAVLGWCAKSVDSLADRMVFRGFANDNFDLDEIYTMNNPDVLPDSAVLSSLIASCSFIYISEDQTGFPRMQVIDGGNATGIIDPITNLLVEGYAVLQRDDMGNPTLEAYFTIGATIYFYKGKKIDVRKNIAPYALLVPIINRPDAVRNFGHSRISRFCMYLQKYAKRVLERADITAEFYSFPQKYVLGTSQDAEKLEKWRATVSSLLEFSKDEEGDKPEVGQFAQQSMTPHIEQFRMTAALFAGETGLTMDDLGFITDNPSSQEAIKAAHETLRATAKKAQRSFGSGFLNAGYLAACVRDKVAYERRQLYLTKPQWEPLFETDAASLSSIGDGVLKINQAIPGYIGKESMRELTGIEGE